MPAPSETRSRYSPEFIVFAGCLIALITFGPRASAGLFQVPMTAEYGWGRDVFGLAIAVQNLLWGLGQPFAGAVADRFGAVRVLCVGALLYAAGLVVMANATSPGVLHLGAGVLLILPLSLALATPRAPASGTGPAALPNQSIGQALAEAFRHRSYVLLVLGFFTCGFQLAFITAHLPAYLKDAGLSAAVGGWTLALIGLANAVGSLSSGWLSTKMSKRWLLAWIYFGRSIAITIFILVPATPVTSILFGISIGLLWLSTVPPTSSLVMLMFGTRYMAMLYGFAFFSHQVGGFLGVWLGGLFYEAYGNYTLVWWLSIALGIASALINLPIKEVPVERAGALQPAE